MAKAIEKSAEGLWLGKMLTKRQARFCLEWFKTTGIARQAYMRAGYQVRSPRVADAGASRLMTNVRVRAKIAEIQDMVLKRAADVTADSLVTELEEARACALANTQTGPAVQATMGKARITGHIVDRKEVGQPGDFERMSEQELRAYIAQHLGNAKPDNGKAIADIAQGAVSEAQPSAVEQLAIADAGLNSADSAEPCASQPEPTHTGTDTKQ